MPANEVQMGNNYWIFFNQLVLRDGRYCAHCKDTGSLTIDHIIPRSQRGSNELENLQLLCRSCNSRKGTKPDPYRTGKKLWNGEDGEEIPFAVFRGNTFKKGYWVFSQKFGGGVIQDIVKFDGDDEYYLRVCFDNDLPSGVRIMSLTYSNFTVMPPIALDKHPLNTSALETTP